MAKLGHPTFFQVFFISGLYPEIRSRDSEIGSRSLRYEGLRISKSKIRNRNIAILSQDLEKGSRDLEIGSYNLEIIISGSRDLGVTI